MGSKLSNNPSLRLAGIRAIVLGLLLVLAAVLVGDDGWTILVVPRAESVGLLALAFILGGWGIRRRLPGALLLLAISYVYLGGCQIVAAKEVFGGLARVEHVLFAAWLWSGALGLGLQSRADRR